MAEEMASLKIQNGGGSMKISNSVLDTIRDRIYDSLVMYQQDLEQAYLVAGDELLDIKFGVKLSQDGARVKVVTGINFVKDRCKDSSTTWVDEEQTNLFDEEGGK